MKSQNSEISGGSLVKNGISSSMFELNIMSLILILLLLFIFKHVTTSANLDYIKSTVTNERPETEKKLIAIKHLNTVRKK